MTTYESRPAVNGAAERSAGRSASDSTIGNRDLRRLLSAVVFGEVGLEDLPPDLAQWYHAGWHDGRASLAERLAQAEADRDRYYRAAFDGPEKLRRRLGAAAEQYWTEFSAEEGGPR